MTSQRMLCCVLVLAGCADRQVSVDDELPDTQPTCMVLPARGYWEDGSSKTITNEWGTTGSVCLCMTEEELRSQSRVEELNDLAYAECRRIERMYWDFGWTECQESYESGEWLNLVLPASGDMAWLNPTGLDCDIEPEESCSITDRDQTPMAALVVIMLLSLRRRRDITARRA